ncbi:MAG: helix-turn-helix transcriptional regulator [Candidatus Omnitrophica bacterium]|nr:helix-turn-helix transcriptional regulator [Candidatus Omnitrophota bacterium]
MALNTIGARIRTLRKTAKLTLAHLAKRSGVALATLSRIETGKMTGTLESHLAIAHALGVPLPDLYREIAAETPMVFFHRAGQSTAKRVSEGPGAGAEVLVKQTGGRRMLPLRLALKPGATMHPETAPPGTERLVAVVSGGLEIQVGAARHALAIGDSLYGAASVAWTLRNPGRTAAQALCVTSPPAL